MGPIITRHQTKTSNSGFGHLKGLLKLQTLHLEGTQITDTGLVYLKRMANLETLSLPYTDVTDAGLEDLRARQSVVSCH